MPSDTALKRERRRQNLPAKQVAELLGVTDRYYCEIENGRSPSFKLAFRIAQVLGKPVQELFRDHNINVSFSFGSATSTSGV